MDVCIRYLFSHPFKGTRDLKENGTHKNTVDMAQFFLLSQMVVGSFYFVVLEANFPTKTNHTTERV